jgi:MerR family mercuric resistance operon transcriptional regulator
MTIGRFAREAGVGTETVRYYQRRGLLPVPSTRSSAYREYDADMLRRLRFIRRVQSAGFTLEEIRALLRLDRSRDRARVLELTKRKLADVELRINELKHIRRALRGVVHDCEQGDASRPCPIIEAFDRDGTGDNARPALAVLSGPEVPR